MQQNPEPKGIWRKCSVCKKDIMLGGKYYLCSVTTCQGQRTGLQFCSVPCFDAHVPAARHREAGAIEKKAPLDLASESGTPQRTLIRPASTSTGSSAQSTPLPKEVLVIASRLKEYIDAKAGMNTSGAVMDLLSNHLRIICDRAIESARADGRKTVMDRDFEFLFK